MSEPADVVRRFFGLLEDGHAAEAVALTAADIEWRNTGLPTLRGERVRTALLQMERRGIRFRADMHHLAADGEAVLTDRTDYLRMGRWEASFWVGGTFLVRDGKVALWDDHYTMGSVVAGSLRGLLGLARRRG